jgi:hypothetical protein
MLNTEAVIEAGQGAPWNSRRRAGLLRGNRNLKRPSAAGIVQLFNVLKRIFIKDMFNTVTVYETGERCGLRHHRCGATQRYC